MLPGNAGQGFRTDRTRGDSAWCRLRYFERSMLDAVIHYEQNRAAVFGGLWEDAVNYIGPCNLLSRAIAEKRVFLSC